MADRKLTGSAQGLLVLLREERERCARVADDYALEHELDTSEKTWSEARWGAIHARRIAARIRGQPAK